MKNIMSKYSFQIQGWEAGSTPPHKIPGNLPAEAGGVSPEGADGMPRKTREVTRSDRTRRFPHVECHLSLLFRVLMLAVWRTSCESAIHGLMPVKWLCTANCPNLEKSLPRQCLDRDQSKRVGSQRPSLLTGKGQDANARHRQCPLGYPKHDIGPADYRLCFSFLIRF
ncbi:MAG: hypothetical protein AB2598_03640 [Candidatus Thiodiazotropha sp.]